jgi:hypothetical protein
LKRLNEFFIYIKQGGEHMGASKPGKGSTKYPELTSGDFGVGAIRFQNPPNTGGGTGNTGSCGVNVSCVLCCCCGKGGGADNVQKQIEL